MKRQRKRVLAKNKDLKLLVHNSTFSFKRALFMTDAILFPSWKHFQLFLSILKLVSKFETGDRHKVCVWENWQHTMKQPTSR